MDRDKQNVYHRFIGVLLKLNETNSHHAVDVGVSVVTVKVVVAVEERSNRRWSNMHCFITVDFLSHDVMRLQQALATNTIYK